LAAPLSAPSIGNSFPFASSRGQGREQRGERPRGFERKMVSLKQSRWLA